MSRQGFTIVSANLSKADFARLKAYLGEQSVNDYLRSLISDDLEEAGDPPLMTIVKRIHRRAHSPIVHGSLTGYTSRKCRCELCRKAGKAYYERWKAQGAMDGVA